MITASYSCRHLIQYIPRSLSCHSHYSHHHHFNFGLSLVNTNGAKVVKIVELELYQNLSIHETWELRASKWATTSNPRPVRPSMPSCMWHVMLFLFLSVAWNLPVPTTYSSIGCWADGIPGHRWTSVAKMGCLRAIGELPFSANIY